MKVGSHDNCSPRTKAQFRSNRSLGGPKPLPLPVVNVSPTNPILFKNWQVTIFFVKISWSMPLGFIRKAPPDSAPANGPPRAAKDQAGPSKPFSFGRRVWTSEGPDGDRSTASEHSFGRCFERAGPDARRRRRQTTYGLPFVAFQWTGAASFV